MKYSIDELLQESEGTSLDFKRDQYRFGKAASIDDKVCFLKDILSFANSFRRTDAFVLIGIHAVKNGAKEIVGISDHLDDASIQQFVNSKTNRPIEFAYEVVQYEGKSIGVIHIPLQNRPFFLTKQLGSIRAGEVWYRLGSSNAIASPDIIVRMASTQNGVEASKEPRIELDVCDPKYEQSLQNTVFTRTSYGIADIDELPDYVPERVTNPFGIAVPMSGNVNRNYWRELAEYIWMRSLGIPFIWHVKNSGVVAARNITITLTQQDNPDLLIRDDAPDEPYARDAIINAALKIRSIHYEHEYVCKGEKWRITSKLGDLQSGTEQWGGDPLYLYAGKSGEYVLNAKVSADNMSVPMMCKFPITVEVKKEPPLTVDDIETILRERS